jgi:hypothetical protein
MAEDRYGKLWRDDELDAIIADYFDMLEADLARRPYVKSKHSAALMDRLGRSHRSVEFKHQNISAVLDELGLPWIRGYRPAPNYQEAISDGIDRYLTQHAEVLQLVLPTVVVPTYEVFVATPELKPNEGLLPPRLRRLVQKYDPVERDHRNRTLGRAGEEFVLEVETKRLVAANRQDLSRQVRWVSDQEGDGAGYDILSFEPGGSELLLEVKTTNGSARTPFFLSRNECAVAMERPQDWRIYRVHQFASDPKIFTIAPPLEASLRLQTETWRASF